MENVREYLKKNILCFDGGMGSLLQKKGLALGELPERWNITHSDVVIEIHKAYVDSGSSIITTNTFGLNGLKYDNLEMKEIAFKAISNAKSSGAKLVAFDIGPCGRMLKPWGDFEFEDAIKLFSEVCKLAKEGGADLILIETMADSYETKAAVLAAKETTDLPIVVTNAYGIDGKLLTGATPKAMVAMLEGLGVDALGANCSLGPKQLIDVAKELTKYASIPVLIQPNAGLPVIRNGQSEYDIDSDEFAMLTSSMADFGVNLFGGCCGTTPEYIEKLKKKLDEKKIVGVAFKEDTIASSYASFVSFDKPVVVGECINPSGKKLLKEAIKAWDIDYILSKGLEQEEKGADILDVNMGVPGTDEAMNLKKAVFALQSVTALPLEIDSSDPIALEKALRIYNGKAVINSVNGKEESLNTVLPLVKKYGGVLVCLLLDENGIPNTVQGRIDIANRIIERAKKFGISKKNLIFDALTLPISADKDAALVTLDTVSKLNSLGLKTILGISNVSFGLPNRDKLNSTFFTLALERKLSAGIINPMSKDMMNALASFNALKGNDKDFSSYISMMTETEVVESTEKVSDLKNAIVKGLKESASSLTKELLDSGKEALDVIDSYIIPALDIVGKRYEAKEIYLPQLLQSAEASKEAFLVIKERAKNTGITKGKIVLATVKGDIHDIGKNIVKLLLQNYGFDVIDLGKDVDKKDILDSVLESKASALGLSALMTTTVKSMEETVSLIKKNAPDVKIVVGGAVLTKDDADRMNVFYAKDAMETVRFSEKWCK